MTPKWTKPKLLANSPFFTERDFRETLDGGQAFRWLRQDDGSYVGVFGRIAARLCLNGSGKVLASFPEPMDACKCEKSLEEYLDCARDYQSITAAQCDSKIKAAAKDFPTLRILRQDPKDAIICFICSSSKRIVQIKQCVAHLAEKLGDDIGGGFKSLPSFESLADADDSVLKDCKLGYRAAYLKKTAQKICSDKFDPESLRTLNLTEAKKYLLTLHGIGEKVADCILLFGAARFEAFPVDTWISKTMAELYGLEHPKKAREFACSAFGENAGYVQQILFASIREKAAKKH